MRPRHRHGKLNTQAHPGHLSLLNLTWNHKQMVGGGGRNAEPWIMGHVKSFNKSVCCHEFQESVIREYSSSYIPTQKQEW